MVAGTADNDMFVFSAHSSGAVEVFRNGQLQAIAAQAVLSDPDGSDTYTVNFGGWCGVLTREWNWTWSPPRRPWISTSAATR